MKSNHTHKLRRDSYSTGKQFYYCVNGCPFKIDVKHSLGMTSLCNSCGQPFSMNEYSIRKAKPKCMNCVKRRTIKDVNNANNVERIESNLSVPTNSISRLKTKISNLTIKEFNPEDESDDL